MKLAILVEQSLSHAKKKKQKTVDRVPLLAFVVALTESILILLQLNEHRSPGHLDKIATEH